MEDLTQQGVYLDDPREEFADFVPPDARRAADVGCGKGGFGRTLRERLGPEAWIVGIESVAEQARVAARGHGFDEVVEGFYPESVPPSWTDLDLVCFMDVLEHVYDPWALLYACHEHLAQGGRVLASIPNIQYLPVLVDLARGRWDYEDTGTLDRTHVRFFTRRSIVEMFHRCGYEVERIEGVSDVLGQFRYRWLRPMGSIIGDARYLHMAVVARRVERPTSAVSLLDPPEVESRVVEQIDAVADSSGAEQRRRDSPIFALRRRGRHLAAIELKFRLGIPTDLACDYGTWRRRRGAPASLLGSQPSRQGGMTRGSSKGRLAVVLHVYYPDLVPELLDRLRVVDVPYDLFVTNATGTPLDLPGTAAGSTLVLDVENRGRDIWPFLQVVQSGLLDGYDAVLKLHTKKSHQGVATVLSATTGDGWREQLVGSLLGSRAAFHDAYGSVTRGRGGLGCHEGSIAGPDAWGTDRRAVRHLARRIRVRCPARGLRFPSGSIYIMRGSLVEVLKGLRMTAADFQDEGDGSYTTTAHAVERLMGYVARSRGLDVVGLQPPAEEQRGR
ncbi:rhamnan synthesis F family protein [Nocardioides sp. SYSU D00065]|uniref:rhamnan synthesis F family protein n=1 Tax=Nocardioides sp. SYSU D00065 TaxID=2817378 RepID=UPI001B3428EC|nr:rhamnan synthesis F family protein [Nocardioides sp. SYSU D00065]